ncbi:C-type lectin domain family 6 member A-like [Etheostoma cragini]|uniref:C-type lectin domain family 6 member A-like n=1 Tax=Etheostoma cragini TaxID=417921 RepID=UPI00155EC3CB|nr:C-type lectin domain family 6 member A-like [Etheostoma cragini]
MERRLSRLLLVSVGLLCVIQAILKVYLRLACEYAFFLLLYSTHSDRNTTHDMTKDLEEKWRLKTEYFSSSFYFVSSMTATWQASRDECLQQGADLVVINSKEEQAFLTKFGARLSIGLTDSETEGTWTWVDGTPLKTSYWHSEEPNGGPAENRVEILSVDSQHNWNNNCLVGFIWDNAPCHTARSIKVWMEEHQIKTLSWNIHQQQCEILVDTSQDAWTLRDWWTCKDAWTLRDWWTCQDA